MRRLIESLAIVACLVACNRGSETIILDADGPFGGVYRLREVNDVSPPLYFTPTWYPGRGTSPNVESITLLSADLTIRPDGSFTWSTLLDEVARKQGTLFPEYFVSKVRRETDGAWSYTESTGAVSLGGIDPSGAYILTGSATSSVLTLTSTFTGGRPNSTFVLER